MARDTLEVLVRVRRTALDGARRALALCLKAEQAAAHARALAEAAITREQETAERLDAVRTARQHREQQNLDEVASRLRKQ